MTKYKIQTFYRQGTIVIKLIEFDSNLINFIKSNFKNYRYDPVTKLWNFPSYKYNIDVLRRLSISLIPNDVKIVPSYIIGRNDGIIILKSMKDNYIFDIIKKIRANWNKEKGWWEINLKPFLLIKNEIIDYIKNSGEKYLIKNIEDLENIVKKRDSEYIKEEYIELSNDVGKKYPFLRNYQRIDTSQMIIENNILNCDDVGLGKTIEVGGVIDFTKANKVLIIAPKAILKQWKQELEKFYNMKDIIVIPDGKKRFKIYEELRKKKTFKIIVNYEKIRIDIDRFFRHIFFNIIVYDEITRLKNNRSKINQTIRNLKTKKTIGLTGTPVENGVGDLYTLMNVIDYRFFGKFKDFEEKYLNPGEFGGYVAKPNAPKMLGEKLKEFDGFIRWKKSEVLSELPDIIQNYYRFQLNGKEKNHYYDIINEKAEVYNINGDLIDLTQILPKLQVLNGFCSDPIIYFDDIHYTSKKKLFYDIITDYINDKKSKVVCFSRFKRVINNYYSFLHSKNINCRLISGDVKQKDREEILDYFKTTESSCILLATDGTISHGVNLQEASFLINIDLPWNPSILHQRIGRLHRMGQKNVVNVLNLVAENTIEEAIVSKIYSKMKVFDDIITINEKSITELIKQELSKK